MTAQTKTQTLIAAAALLTAQQDAFKVGDVVVWKDGMSNKRRPAVGQPVAITQAHETPVRPILEEVNGTPYFNEPLDIAVAMFDEDGDLLEFHQDSRRFRIATQEDIDAWEKQQAEAE